MNHTLAVIVLVYNSADDACICIDRLLSFNLPLRVVVVDNRSTDGSYDVLNNAYEANRQVDVVQADANGGYSAGNNFGIRYAMGHYDFDTVAIMNPDVVIPTEEVLLSLMELLWSSDDVLAVGGQPLNHLDGDANWPSSWSLPTARGVVSSHCLLSSGEAGDNAIEVAPKIFSVDCVVGCFFLARLDMFLEIGLFDEGVFLYNEENILGLKCRAAGLRILVDKNQIYYHNHSTDALDEKPLKARIRSSRVGYMSRRYLAKKYYTPALVFPLWCAEAINELVIVAGCLRRALLGSGSGPSSHNTEAEQRVDTNLDR